MTIPLESTGQTNPTGARPRSAAHEAVEIADRVQFLYGRLPAALLTSVLVALVLASGQWAVTPIESIATWGVIFGTVTFGRFALALAYRRVPHEPPQAHKWLQRFRIGALAAGLSWALGAFLLFPADNMPHQVFVGFAVTGITAGAAASIASDRRAFLLFAGPPLATLALLFAGEPGLLPGSIVAMVVFYAAFIVANSAQTTAWLSEIARLKNDALHRADRLADNEQRLLHLFDTTSDLIQSVGPDRRIMFVNRAWRETLGYSDEEAIGRDAFDFIAPNCVEHCAAVFQELRTGKEQVMIDVTFLAKDGRRVPLEGNITVQIENGIPVATKAFLRDVTARRNAEEALRALNVDLETRVAERTAALADSERFNHGIINSISAELAVLDPNGVIIAANAIWNRNAEESSQDWMKTGVGANYLDACDRSAGPHAAEAQAIAAGIRTVIAGGQDAFRHEYSIPTQAGARWYTLRATMFTSSDRRRVVVTHIDNTAVHEAVNKASANEQVLASLARVSPVGFFRAQVNGTCEFVNHRWCEIAGMSEEAALGTGYLQAIHPDDRSRLQEAWKTATNSGGPFRCEFRFMRSDGAISWVISQAVKVTGPDGETAGYVGTLTDITDRKRVEMAMQALSSDLINFEGTAYLEAAVKRLSLLLDMELCAISQYDPLQTNPMRTLTMVEDGIIQPASKAQVSGSPGGMVAAGKPVVIEHGAQARYPDARLIQTRGIDSYIGEPLLDPAGKAIGHIAAMSRRPIRDIETTLTILRMFAVAISAEIIRERNQRQYTDLFQFAPDGLMMIDSRGRIALANLRAEEIFGWSRDEMIGQPIEKLIPADNRAHQDHLFKYQDTPDPRGMEARQKEVRGIRKDGTEFPADVHVAPVESDNGVLIAAAVRDVTGRKALEAQLAQAGRLEAIGRITGGLAHDFNNYLGIIIGHLDLLQETAGKDPRTAKHVSAALTGALRSAELTQSLLAYSRKQPLTPRLTDVSQRIRSLVPLLEHTLGKDVALDVRMEEDLWPIKVDGAQLDSCFVNLATNARDAMPKGGSLIIEARNITLDADHCTQSPDAQPGDHLLIEIKDTGQGMPPEILAQAFEPFFTTKGPGHGTGLGLSMVYGFVRQSGGHVRLASTLEKATEVRIYLPRAAALSSDITDQQTAKPMPHGSEGILVVEDNAQVLRAAVDQIESLGYRVVAAENAEAALHVLETDADLALLFTDIVMPGDLNGYQLAEHARKRFPHVKILLTSGFPGDNAGQPHNGELPAPMLNKPYRKDQLATAIRSVLDTQSAA